MSTRAVGSLSGKMSHKCESCGTEFSKATELFEHIQASCLDYYKKHPGCWTRILANLGPEEDGKEKEQEPSTPRTRRRTNNASSSASTPQSSPAPQAKGPQTPSTSSRCSTPVAANKEKETYKCKCGKSFQVFEEYSDHGKGCSVAAGKEPPFCIMFRAQTSDAGKPAKNVHMTVSDYFYGALTGRNLKEKKIVRRNNCYSCSKTLRNNIRFMSHLRHKVVNEWEKGEEGREAIICNHCFRHYESPFHLQCHLETVHGSEPAACTCRICELNFSSEKSFLFHMKDKHVHHELPYVCKVCNFRSSFYNDVTKHFREVHVDTSALMCPFCLSVQHQSHTFLKHVIQHIKKGADCQRCRLQFVSVKERAIHLNSDHNSNILKSKRNKFKNLGQCQVFVRVSSLPMIAQKAKPKKPAIPAPSRPGRMLNKVPIEVECGGNVSRPLRSTRQHQSEAPKRPIEEPPRVAEGVPAPKKPAVTSGVQLPAYLCPLKKLTKIRRVKLPKTLRVSSFKCWECKEMIQGSVTGLKLHYENAFECRWCIYVTSCQKAAQNHVLQEHADAELRKELLAKPDTDSQTFVATVDGESSSSNSPAVKAEPDTEMPSILEQPPVRPTQETRAKEKTPSKDSAKKKSTGKPSWKTRRKQSNPMKIADEVEKDSPKAKRSKKQLPPENIGIIHPENLVVKEFRRPGVKIQPQKNPPNANKKPPTNRKVLAPEGYFPDLDDDEGWAKYFEQCEGTSYPLWKKKPPAPKFAKLPTMVPQSGATKLPYGMPHIPPLKPLKPKPQPSPGSALPDIVPNTTNSQPPSSKILLSTQEVRMPRKDKETGPVGSGTFTGFLTPVSNVLTQMQSPMVSVTATLPVAPTSNATGPVYQFQLVQNKQALAGAPPLPQQRPQNPLSLGPAHPHGMVSNVRTMISQVPQTPVNLRCLEATHSSLLIQWDPPRDCLVTHYKVIFQGSGAPTVQLLPPEQTLVRLVGLKSDTMYVVRVYSLCNKAVSQYAFLYQKTKKLRQEPPRPPKDDVVFVIDDGETSDVTQDGESAPSKAQPEPEEPILTQAQTEKAAKVFKGVMERTRELAGHADVRHVMNSILIKVEKMLIINPDATKFTSDDFKKMTSRAAFMGEPGAMAPSKNVTTSKASAMTQMKKTAPDKKTKPPAVDLGTNVKSYLEVEKKEKRILINELLEGLKKNKKKLASQKAKALIEVTLDGTKEVPKLGGEGSTLVEVTLDTGSKVVLPPSTEPKYEPVQTMPDTPSTTLRTLAVEVLTTEPKSDTEDQVDTSETQDVVMAPSATAPESTVPQPAEATYKPDDKNVFDEKETAEVGETTSTGPQTTTANTPVASKEPVAPKEKAAAKEPVASDVAGQVTAEATTANVPMGVTESGPKEVVAAPCGEVVAPSDAASLGRCAVTTEEITSTTAHVAAAPKLVVVVPAVATSPAPTTKTSPQMVTVQINSTKSNEQKKFGHQNRQEPRQIMPKAAEKTSLMPSPIQAVMSSTTHRLVVAPARVAVPVTLLIAKPTATIAPPEVLDGQAYVVSNISSGVTTLTAVRGGGKGLVTPQITRPSGKNLEGPTATATMPHGLQLNTKLATLPLTTSELKQTVAASVVTGGGIFERQTVAAPSEQVQEPDLEDCDTEFNIVNVVSLCDTGGGSATEDAEMPQDDSEMPQDVVETPHGADEENSVTESGYSEVPQGDQLVPQKNDSVPQEYEPAPSEDEPVPQKNEPVPRKDESMPPSNQNATTTNDGAATKFSDDVILIDEDGPMLGGGSDANITISDDDCVIVQDEGKSSEAEETGTDATNAVDDAINKELEILGGSPLPSGDPVCGNPPTLDDIKDIMDEDMAWF